MVSTPSRSPHPLSSTFRILTITLRTALHWASHRSHENIVRALLAHGADATAVTFRGQTAADLAKTDAMRALLGRREGGATLAEPELPFVPNYIREPDLNKLWSVP